MNEASPQLPPLGPTAIRQYINDAVENIKKKDQFERKTTGTNDDELIDSMLQHFVVETAR